MAQLQNIQALRGVAVLSVVLFHLMTVERRFGGPAPVLPSFVNFGMFGVDLFFVISGFVMVLVTQGQFRKPPQALRFLYHRVSRIYPTYWVYSTLVLIVFLVRPSLVNNSQGNRADILASFLLLPADTLPLLMVGWTLIFEMYFYWVFFFLLLLIREAHFLRAVMIWGGLVIVVSACCELQDPFLRTAFSPLTLEFILGCLIATNRDRIGQLGLGTRALLSIALVALAAGIAGYAVYSAGGPADALPNGWSRVALFGIPAVVIVASCVAAERNGFLLHSALTRIGDASYSIYLSHLLTLNALGRVWSMFASDSVYDNLVMVPFMFIAATGFGVASYHYLEKPLLDITRKLPLASLQPSSRPS